MSKDIPENALYEDIYKLLAGIDCRLASIENSLILNNKKLQLILEMFLREKQLRMKNKSADS